MRFRAKSIAEDLAKAFTGFEGPMAAAATAAVYEAGEFGKRWGRSAIAAGGMSARWQNALRANAYPRRPKTSIDAAVWFYHRIPYAHVFQDGATISGSPLLWARTSAAPQRMGRGRFSKRFTPAAARDAGIKLFSFKSRSGTPLLGAKVRGNRISLAALKRGPGDGRGTVRTVALFAGIPAARLRRRFDLRPGWAAVERALPGLYFDNLKV